MPAELVLQLLLFFGSFVIIWFSAGVAITELSKLAEAVQVSRFILSFFLLGILTSLPEISIGVNALITHDPQIIVGTMIGGVIVLFLLVIPLLSITGNGVKIPKEMQSTNLLLPMLTILAPSLLTADGSLGQFEGVLLIILYSLIFIFVSSKHNVLDRLQQKIIKKRFQRKVVAVKIFASVALMLVAANQIVRSTEFIAEIMSWSPFIVSLLLISLGTNAPELSIVIRSVLSKKQDVALADYLGSAAANSVVLGVFSIMNQGPILIPNHHIHRMAYLLVGLLLFAVFARSDRKLSRLEGLIMISLYGMFFLTELTRP